MTNEQDPEATIRALEAQLEAARSQARIEAMEAELAALKAQGGGAADAAADEAAAKAAEEAAAAKAAEEAAAKEAAERAAALERAAAMEAELAALKAQQASAAAASAAAQAPAAAAPAAPAQAAPAQAAPAPHPAQAPKGRKGLVASLVVLLLALGATLGGTYFAIRGDIRAPWAAAPPLPTDVVLIAAGEPGPAPAVSDPVLPAVFEDLSGPATGTAPDPVATLSVASVAGDTPEIYGLSYASCTYLDVKDEAASPAIAAFVAALNADDTLGVGRALTVEDFSLYLRQLTFGHLLADTRVTYNGYSAGASFPMQAVLQRGTLVGMDRFGVPRLHCGSGVALTPPSTASGEIRFSGTAWGNLDLGSLVTITAASSAQDSFTVRPVGPANVTTPFPVSPRICAWSAPGACPGATELVETPAPEKMTSAPAPVATECSNWADGTTNDDSVGTRIVNASSPVQNIYMVENASNGCGPRLDYAIGVGESSVLRYWPGALVLFTDGKSADATGQYTFGELTLFVIQ